MTEAERKKPLVIELDDTTPAKTGPAEAPPVPEPDLPMAPQGQAMKAATGLAARKPSLVARLFWWALGLLVTTMVSIAFWDFAAGMMARNIWLGRGITALIAVILTGLLVFAVNELAAMLRLRKIDSLKRAYAGCQSGTRSDAVTFANDLRAFYADRPELRWDAAKFDQHCAEALTAADVLHVTEVNLLAPLDDLARKEIEAAARLVATATAIVPLALADVVIALTGNVRMVRRISQVYGGRSGRFGSWRLMRAVATHLVATGAVAVTDDLISTIAGGGVLSKVSRRFGEGVVNGALTARVGIAALEVCRPMPFAAQKRPNITAIMKQALTGFFGK
jgi:putative membrane protein